MTAPWESAPIAPEPADPSPAQENESAAMVLAPTTSKPDESVGPLRLAHHVPTVALFTHHLKTGQASAVRDYARHWAARGDRTAIIRFESGRVDVQVYADRRTGRPGPPTPIPYAEDDGPSHFVSTRRPIDLTDLTHHADRIVLWGLRQSVATERLILASSPAATILVDAVDPDLTETYRTIKQCHLCGIERNPTIFIVNAGNENDVDFVESKLRSLCDRFLDLQLQCEGFVFRPPDVTLTPWPLKHDGYSSADTPQWAYQFVEMLQSHGCPPHVEDAHEPFRDEAPLRRAELQTQRGIPLDGPILNIDALDAAIETHLGETIDGLRDSRPVAQNDPPDTIIRIGRHPAHAQLVIVIATHAAPGLIENALAQLTDPDSDDLVVLLAPALTPAQRQAARALPCPVRFHALRQILLHHNHALLIDPPETL